MRSADGHCKSIKLDECGAILVIDTYPFGRMHLAQRTVVPRLRIFLALAAGAPFSRHPAIDRCAKAAAGQARAARSPELFACGGLPPPHRAAEAA